MRIVTTYNVPCNQSSRSLQALLPGAHITATELGRCKFRMYRDLACSQSSVAKVGGNVVQRTTYGQNRGEAEKIIRYTLYRAEKQNVDTYCNKCCADFSKIRRPSLPLPPPLLLLVITWGIVGVDQATVYRALS